MFLLSVLAAKPAVVGVQIRAAADEKAVLVIATLPDGPAQVTPAEAES